MSCLAAEDRLMTAEVIGNTLRLERCLWLVLPPVFRTDEFSKATPIEQWLECCAANLQVVGSNLTHTCILRLSPHPAYVSGMTSGEAHVLNDPGKLSCAYVDS